MKMNNEIILICFILALNIYLMKLNLCDNTLCMIFLLFSAIMFVDVLTISNNAIELTFALAKTPIRLTELKLTFPKLSVST